MSNVLTHDEQQQVLTLGRLGWSLRQIRDRRGFGHLDQAVALYGFFFILFNLVGVLVFRDSPIAYAAHAGGFVAGWLMGGWRARRSTKLFR